MVIVKKIANIVCKNGGGAGNKKNILLPSFIPWELYQILELYFTKIFMMNLMQKLDDSVYNNS
jgi:hypothetical protein